ncbi:MAG: hypothetical protein ACR2RB_02950 [Gammaproteobacteria bacterium]
MTSQISQQLADRDLEQVMEIASTLSHRLGRLRSPHENPVVLAHRIRLDLQHLARIANHNGMAGLEKICVFISANLRAAAERNDGSLGPLSRHLGRLFPLLIDYLDEPRGEETIASWISYLTDPAMPVPLRDESVKTLSASLTQQEPRTRDKTATENRPPAPETRLVTSATVDNTAPRVTHVEPGQLSRTQAAPAQKNVVKRAFGVMLGMGFLGTLAWTLFFLFEHAQTTPISYVTNKPIVTSIVRKAVAAGSIVPRK